MTQRSNEATPETGRGSWGVAARAWVPAVLALAGVALALLTQFLLTDLKGTVPTPAYGFAIAVALFGASAFARRRSAVSGMPAGEVLAAEPAAQPTLPIRLEIALFAGVLLLAIFFRFWRFLEFPPGHRVSGRC